MKLERHHRTNPAWLAIKDQAMAERKALYVTLAGDHDPITTAKLRGRIYQLTVLIEMDQEEPVAPEYPAD